MLVNQTLATYLPQIISSEALFEDQVITIDQIKALLAHQKTTLTAAQLNVVDPLNMAWHYLMHHSLATLSLKSLQTINQIVAVNDSLDPGQIRTGTSEVALTTDLSYRPPLVEASTLNAFINQLPTKPTVEQVLTLTVQLIIMQPFWDGNKRTMFLGLNWWLTMHADFVIVIPNDLYADWQTVLTTTYRTKQIQIAATWLDQNARLTI